MSGPVTSDAWLPGDDTGQRQFATMDAPFVTEGGGELPELTVAYETWGTLDPSATNAVLVLHALTGGSHAAGPAGPGHASVGWWDGLIGPGRPLDTDRYFLVCPSVLGGCQGTTGPTSPDPTGRPYAERFPSLTIRDQVAAEALLADALGIERWAGVVGGSMGGMRVLEWCVGHPQRVERAVVVAVGARATADEIALCSLQAQAIRSDADFRGGAYAEAGVRPTAGLALARGIGQFSYRTAAEFEERFGREAQDGGDVVRGGRFAVDSYLRHHGEKLAAWFDANSYLLLSEAMNRHDVGRERGGIAAALASVTAEVVVAGIDSDRLYPYPLQEELARLLPGGRPAQLIRSPAGHDGFLLELDQVGAVISGIL